MDKNKLAALSNKFIIKKIQMANIVFLIDGSNELTNEDYNCVDFLRKYKQKVILLVNKVELKQAKNYENAGYNLGFGKPIQITGKSKLAKLLIDEIIESFLDKIKLTENIYKALKKLVLQFLENQIQENLLYLTISMGVIEW